MASLESAGGRERRVGVADDRAGEAESAGAEGHEGPGGKGERGSVGRLQASGRKCEAQYWEQRGRR